MKGVPKQKEPSLPLKKKWVKTKITMEVEVEWVDWYDNVKTTKAIQKHIEKWISDTITNESNIPVYVDIDYGNEFDRETIEDLTSKPKIKKLKSKSVVYIRQPKNPTKSVVDDPRWHR